MAVRVGGEYRNYCIAAFFVVLFAVIVYVFVAGRSAQDVVLMKGKAASFNTGWYYYDADGHQQPIPILPASIPAALGESVQIYHAITTKSQETCICFYTHHQSAALSLNGRILYRYEGNAAPPWITTWRSFHHIVPLPAVSQGVLCLAMDGLIPSRHGELSGMYIGSYVQILHSILMERCGKIVLGIVLFIFGLFVLFLAALFDPSNGKDPVLFHLAVLIILVGIWQIEESRTLQFFIGSQPVHWCLEYVIQFFILFDSYLFIQDLSEKKESRITTAFFFVDMAVAVLQLLLQVTGLMQLTTSTFLSQIVYIASLVYVTYLFNKRIVFDRATVRWLFTASMAAGTFLLLLISLSIIDLRYTDMVMSIALFCMFISLTLVVYQRALKKFEAIRQADVYQKMAFVDFSTGVASRTAWFTLVEQFNPAVQNLGHCCLMLFDMNNLKTLNDTYGHLVGDRVISSFCTCLQQAVGTKGTIYRIGGDEFICFCKNTTVEIVHRIMADFDHLVANQNDAELSFTVAYGSVFFYPKDKEDFIQAQQTADARMYETKRKMKESY